MAILYKNIRQIIIGISILVGLTSCSTMDTVKNAPLDQGISQSFNAPYDHTVAATVKALSTLNVDITSSSETAQGTMYLVNKPMSAFSWGEVGRVYVKKTSTLSTTVTVDWEKRYQLQISGTDADEFSTTLFSTITKSL